MKTLCIIESPYAGEVEKNVAYAERCCRDSYERGEQPFASHLLYPRFMDDTNAQERADGIAFGYALWRPDSLIAFYTDNGWSNGMKAALQRAIESGGAIRFCQRQLYPGDRPVPTELSATLQQHLLHIMIPQE